MRHSPLLLICLASVLAFGTSIAEANEKEHFDRQIAPLLARRCLSCHSGFDPKGQLNLSTLETAMKGGESGDAIVAGKIDESLVWEYIESDEMPPKKPLRADEKALLKSWIASGAKWGTPTIDPFRFTTASRAGYDWWSLQPISKANPPAGNFPEGWTDNPVDHFVYSRLMEAKLTPSQEADKLTLIRRLSFDLLGLPPTPDQIAKFVSDTAPDAYEKLVDRTLESPHYGERWARHWLDVVRFGESNGFEYDQPRNNAWYYRNWVIDALNQDMPYDEFVRRQIAGDVLDPTDHKSVAAAGFLVAGAHNTTLPQSQPMRMTMAQDELEELVGVVGQTFLGLTVNCARCHDHKFDPISQKNYYQFAANLTGVRHGERTVKRTPSPDNQKRIQQIDLQLAALSKEVVAIEEPVRTKIIEQRQNGVVKGPEPPQAYSTWEFDGDATDSRGKLNGELVGGAKFVDGAVVVDGKGAFVKTTPIPVDVEEKTLEAWVQLDNLQQRGGGVISIQTTNGVTFDAIVFGEREPKRWMAGSNSFVRTRPFGGDEEVEAKDRPVHFAIVYTQDGYITGYRDGKLYGKAYKPGAIQKYAANSAQIIFGLRHGSPGSNRMLNGKITRAQFYNRALKPEEVALSAGARDIKFVSEATLVKHLNEQQRKRRTDAKNEIVRLNNERQSLASTTTLKIYTCVSSNPGESKLLRRGNVLDPGETVLPTGLSAVPGADADFKIPANANDADRRKKLAQWITDQNNPLFSRVIVNRLWHYHFGQGLVTTPNDFGYNGGQPSHPQLLEWLAQQLRANDYRLKPMHRLLVTSATYKQASKSNPAAVKVDANNQWLWRKSPQRLEAEAIRDAVLLISDHLDLQTGGQGYRDVRHFAFKGSNFYEPLDEVGQQKLRRTIYRFSPRGGRNPFLDTFDCPDPSTTAPNRANTTTPLQALALLNNPLVFHMSDLFAKRVSRQAGNNMTEQVKLTIELAYGRDPEEEEISIASEFAEKFGLPALCRVIFNSNEFVFVQ